MNTFLVTVLALIFALRLGEIIASFLTHPKGFPLCLSHASGIHDISSIVAPYTCNPRSQFFSNELIRTTHTKFLERSIKCTNGENDSNQMERNNKRVAVLICPAQFCVPADYQSLITNIRNQLPGIIASCRVAPLPRTEWIKVAKQLPTKDFVDATLPCHRTLNWYFRAMETALGEIYAEDGEDIDICIIGHSIGGWVARAYLGGLSHSCTAIYRLTQQRCKSFISLGTPHTSPESALVDQTRGLLKEVERNILCSSQSLVSRGIKVTCVGSKSVPGSLLSLNLEELVAFTSYVPLLGIKHGIQAKGDGIIPLDLAFMEEPARKVEIERCETSGRSVRHAHVFPTPWNLWDGGAPSLSMPDDFLWYGSDGIINQWAEFIQ